MNGNYIKINRSLLEWGWYQDINTCRLFVHLLLRANWKDGNFQGEVIKRGSVVSSIAKLSAETNLSVREVRTAISHLEKTGELTVTRHSKYSVFTVNNYCLYQASDTQNDRQFDKVSTEYRQGIDKVATTIEEKKEGKKERNNIRRFEPPAVETVRAYCIKRNNHVDPQLFVDFYESKNWMVGKNKMKDWKAAVRTWEKGRSQTRKEETAKHGSTKFSNFEGRDYNMDSLESQLLGG